MSKPNQDAAFAVIARIVSAGTMRGNAWAVFLAEAGADYVFCEHCPFNNDCTGHLIGGCHATWRAALKGELDE